LQIEISNDKILMIVMEANLEKDDRAIIEYFIYKKLRRSIITGHRKPGSCLIVKDNAENYKISVTPIRDARQMLSQDGLVTFIPLLGYYITALTLEELRDLLDLRRILEVAAIEKAVLRIITAQIDALRNVHAGYTGKDDASYESHTDENLKFHHPIAVASGNLALAEP
jgi:DNA-binding GntR family transcriptional regulator